VNGSLPSDDSYINQGQPDQNFGGAINFWVRPNNNADRRGVIRFDLSAIPANATITGATLYLYETNRNPGIITYLYRVTTSWSEDTVTWNNPWAAAGGDFDDTISFASFMPDQSGCMVTLNITDLVQRWVNGTYPNYGILMYSTGPNRSIIYISKENANSLERPRLDVSYTIAQTSPLEDGLNGMLTAVTKLWNSLISVISHRT